ncbi:hypothetical protein HH219_12610 [Pseudoalteromonas sp. NEC-BIFX-2020_015]|uniref:hypothetical protein n=1 Tax=Pseudoalteromonas sp. NEC-BIFX-2020_015 TaxID=2729544 RepID=UPI001461700F|nr:hypothetical protein [Pseudoalteromonas sp. NEC-BIFX-2020_015]NMR26363.1 hypothetical protein [Pseudoalteromonas sp. NEC-BIFX-2020_015]
MTHNPKISDVLKTVDNKELNKITDIIELQTLPKLQASALNLQNELKKNDIIIGSLKDTNNAN